VKSLSRQAEAAGPLGKVDFTEVKDVAPRGPQSKKDETRLISGALDATIVSTIKAV
jgi:hypothetical protein